MTDQLATGSTLAGYRVQRLVGHGGMGTVWLAERADGTFERLVALSARAVMNPRPSPEPGVRMAFVADPEGNLLELLDRSDGSP